MTIVLAFRNEKGKRSIKEELNAAVHLSKQLEEFSIARPIFILYTEL